MKFLTKLREKPEHIRKIILWTIVILSGLIFAVWWVSNSKERLNEFRDKNILKEINLPDLKQENQ